MNLDLDHGLVYFVPIMLAGLIALVTRRVRRKRWLGFPPAIAIAGC